MTFRSKEEAGAWLAGIIDGEGHVACRFYIYESGKTVRGRYVTVTNTDYSIIEACVEASLLLGLRHRLRPHPVKPGRKKAWIVVFSTREVLLKIAELPLRSTRKREALTTALASYQTPMRLPREILEQLYVFDQLNTYEIAKLHGVGDGTVRRWLQHYEIPMRDRSAALRVMHARRRPS